MALTTYRWEPADGSQTQAERAYIALNGGTLWECIGSTPGPHGHLDTAYGNSEADAVARARAAGLA